MIRVFLADDHQLVREGLKRVFEDENDIVVVGEAASGEDVLASAGTEGWDVLVLGLNLPGRSGADVLRHLKASYPERRVLVLSVDPENQLAVRLLTSGADGYLTKSRSVTEIVDAIRGIATEGKYITPRLAELMLRSKAGGEAAPHASLSNREMDILVMLSKGKQPSAIALSLGVSASTVSTHLRRIKTKLGLSSSGELIQYAVKAGLV